MTREERDSTRGRRACAVGNAQGNHRGRLARRGVKETLDLCLACKGCKGDCPVNVDMATYKAEFLSHHYEGRLRPRTAYAMDWIDKWAHAGFTGSAASSISSRQTPLLRDVAKWLAGIAARSGRFRRSHRETFQAWFRRHTAAVANAGLPPVILWPDTFNNHFFPEVCRRRSEVLEAAGFQVQVPRRVLLRPPAVRLRLARHGQGDTCCDILRALWPEIHQGIPLVVLEPSCCAVFRDELTQCVPARLQDAKGCGPTPSCYRNFS